MKRFEGLWVALLSGLALPLALGCAPAQVVMPPGAMPQGITVSGHGEAQGRPDIARVTLGVEARAKLATEATEQSNRQMTAVIAALKQQGIRDEDLRTQNFSIHFEQQPEPYPPPPAPAPAGAEPRIEAARAEPEGPRGFYRVSNTVLVTVRDLDQLGAVLGAAAGAGANNVWGLQLEIEDPAPLEAQARQHAVAQARARAEQLARLAGVTLGKVLAISEGGGPVMGRAEGIGFSMKAMNADVPVQRGELVVTQDVQMVFATE